MKLADFEKSIREAFSCLVNVGLSSWDRMVSLRCLQPSPEFRRVAYSSEVTYQEVYKTGLRYRNYNFLLTEFSYFQFWHDSKPDARTLRYAYYTSPFDISQAEQTALERSANNGPIETDEIYQQALEDSPLKIGKPPIRFDLDLDSHIESTHPSAHLTVGAFIGNRWPVARVLTPKLFVLFICKHYYPDCWNLMNQQQQSTHGFLNSLDQTLADEKRASGLIPTLKFTAREKLHPYVE